MEGNVLLFIADISGYTKYMVENKNAYVHAQIIITELLETIIKELNLPFEVSKLEGDAVFFYHKVESDEIIADSNGILDISLTDRVTYGYIGYVWIIPNY